MPRQGCRESTDYTFLAGGQRMPEPVIAFWRRRILLEAQRRSLDRLVDTMIANIPNKVEDDKGVQALDDGGIPRLRLDLISDQ